MSGSTSSASGCRRTSSFGPPTTPTSSSTRSTVVDGSVVPRLESCSSRSPAPRWHWNERYLDPTPNRDIVIRMLNNLKSVFAGRSDAVRLAIVMDLRSAQCELAELEAAEIAATSAIFN